MRLKNIGIMATLISFGVCSLVSATPKRETKIEENTEVISSSGNVEIVFIGNEETEVTKDEYNLLLRVCFALRKIVPVRAVMELTLQKFYIHFDLKILSELMLKQ